LVVWKQFLVIPYGSFREFDCFHGCDLRMCSPRRAPSTTVARSAESAKAL
jgi:hypothetical protein